MKIMPGLLIYFSFFIFSSPWSIAQNLPTHCDVSSAVRSQCSVSVASLRPTQFCVGELEVKLIAKSLKSKSEEAYRKWIANRILLVVKGPEQTWYLVDGHHHAKGVAELRRSDLMVAEIVADRSTLKWDQFWAQMKNDRWVYLYDENDRGPLEPSRLPLSLMQMKDDPYRSLSNAVKDVGGYRKTDVPYAQFYWARFFRQRISLSELMNDFNLAVQKAKSLAHSAAAAGLPGYCGPRCDQIVETSN